MPRKRHQLIAWYSRRDGPSASSWVNEWFGCNADDKPGKTGTYYSASGCLSLPRTTEDRIMD